jgi:hypothetical protein
LDGVVRSGSPVDCDPPDDATGLIAQDGFVTSEDRCGVGEE